MSQENVEIAEQAIAAINQTYETGDMLPWREHVEATCAPEIVLEAGTEAFTEGPWRGHDGLVGFVANQMEVLDGMWLRIDEYVYVSDNWIILGITFGGRARHTGIEVELHPIHVFKMRDGKAARWQVFTESEREQALKVVGLEA
jgi:ketosteroid isomerase-like protein